MTTKYPFSGNFAFKRGSRAANDRFTGHNKTLSLDMENHILRLHDGVTPGGHPIVSTADNLLIFDPAVTSNLGTVNEKTALNLSCLARSAYQNTTIVYSVVSGALPPGLTISSSGVITGTVGDIQATTVYNFRIRAFDHINIIERDFTLTVVGANVAPVWATASGLGTITAANISIQLSATDPEVGSAGLRYSLISGALPPGITLSQTGLISGPNPRDGLTYTFTIGVTDGIATVNRTFTLTVDIVHGSVTYTASGNQSFTTGDGVTSVMALVIGAGGGGGASHGVQKAAGGGGSGGYTYQSIAVTPNTTYVIPVTIGVGGNPGPEDGVGGTGGTTSMTLNGVTKSATGGGGGWDYEGAGGGAGGAGGAGASGNGNAGGAGGLRYGNGGVGGSSYYTNLYSTQTAGIAGVYPAGSGGAGTYGGGGGGASAQNDGDTSSSGGRGGNGIVRIIW